MGSSSAAFGALILAAGLASAAGAGCAPGMADVRLAGGQVQSFAVDIADTPGLREKGLMFRDQMATDAGMLFTYPSARHVYYWMKDTHIALDLLFVDPSGTVKVVKSQAKPMDLTPIDGGEGVRYVLEINGGLAATMGLAPGVHLRAEAMDQAQLVWRCR